MTAKITGMDDYTKQFLQAFDLLRVKNSGWKVWSDFCLMAACAISNRCDLSNKHDRREDMYIKTISSYDTKERELFPQLLRITIDALESNPYQDFLGNLFQKLELHNHWCGQFFTPYHISQVMAKIQVDDSLMEKVHNEGFVTVNDPACGAGGLLIAFMEAVKSYNVNYQQSVLFTAQDIDYTAAMMCYIQLSLLGVPGMVIVGDTLSNPPTEPMSYNYDVWYTPFYILYGWRFKSKRTDTMSNKSLIKSRALNFVEGKSGQLVINL